MIGQPILLNLFVYNFDTCGKLSQIMFRMLVFCVFL